MSLPADLRADVALMAGPVWIGFDEPDRHDSAPPQPGCGVPLLIGFEAPEKFGPPGERWHFLEPPLGPNRRVPALALLGALSVHLLVLLALTGGSGLAIDAARPIPVRLVIEKPAKPPEASAPPALRDPPDASVEPAAKLNATAKAVPSATAPEGAPRLPAMASPPSEHAPVALAGRVPAKPLPQQLPRRTAGAAPRHQGLPDHDSPRSTVAVLRPDATRDEYMASLVALTRRHLDLLPASFVGGRRGVTVLHLTIQTDGTVTRIAIAQGSGYPDIDAKVQQMVAAVHRFPPLPRWFQGSAMDLDFRLRFPDALE